MHRLGIAVPSLGAGHLSYVLVRNVNQLLRRGYDTDVVLFYENLTRPGLWPDCAVMQMAEAFGYDAPMIATSLSTAEKLLRFPGPAKRVFYVWDLEWLRLGNQKQFEHLQSVYGNTRLMLVARSRDHARVLENAWNRPVAAIVEDFALKPLLEIACG